MSLLVIAFMVGVGFVYGMILGYLIGKDGR